jgi:hypothetical protein
MLHKAAQYGQPSENILHIHMSARMHADTTSKVKITGRRNDELHIQSL